jgi:hypothetical protein
MRSLSLLSLPVVVAFASCGRSVIEPTPAFDTAPRWANVGKSCDDNAPAVLLSPVRRDSLPPEHAGNSDQRWVDLARSAPGGIGGIFQVGPNGTGDYFIWLTDPSKKTEAIEAIIAAFPGLAGFFPFERAHIVQGRWDFAQLADWYRYLLLKRPPGIWSSDIQEGSNRLEFGVPNEEARTALEQWLTALDVPCRLVAIRIQPPISWL